MKLVKISEYAKLKGVSVRTLKRRIKEGLLKYEKTDSGRIMIPIESLKDEYIVTYARVSSSENKDNLIILCANCHSLVHRGSLEINEEMKNNRKLSE